ncbi:MAG: AsmA family protein [Rhodobacteraceae bacterium]|nr:AsmA family protein [Paracoccaceae bacterium]
MELNSVYISLGVAIILVLVAALVGPFFVDWTVYRSTFERYAERALGHQVKVLGEADLRFLPSPSVTFSDVRVGGAEDPLLSVSKFRMRIELPPLLKGEIRVLDMQMESPRLQVALDERGRLDWFTAMAPEGALARLDNDDVMFESVSIIDGELTLVDARTEKSHRITNANLNVSARSLAGPYKIDGSVNWQDQPVALRIATGKQTDDGLLRIKTSLTPSRWPVELSLDGNLSEQDDELHYDGEFVAQEVAGPDSAWPWSATGAFMASSTEIDIPEFSYRLGTDERYLSLEGKSSVELGDRPFFSVSAQTKQLDLDRLFGSGPQNPMDVVETGSVLMTLLNGIPTPPIKGSIDLDVPTVVLGGALAQDMKLDLTTIPGGWRIERFSGRAPGRTRIVTGGDLVLGANAAFRGNVSVQMEQPEAFAAWLRNRRAEGPALDAIDVEGRLNLQANAVALENFRLESLGSKAKGGMSYRVPRSSAPTLSLTLDADRLDLDQLEQFLTLVEVGESPKTKMDLSVRMQAKQIQYRGVGGKQLALEAAYSDSVLRIDRLTSRDMAGADIDVSGRIDDPLSAPAGKLTGTLKAQDLQPMHALLQDLFPESAVLQRLKTGVDFMGPAEFEASLDARAVDDGSSLVVVLDGDAGGVETRFEGHLTGRVDNWETAEIGLDLTMASDDGAQILRQFGFDVLPIESWGNAKLELSAQGVSETGLELALSAQADAGVLSGDGSLRVVAGQEPSYRFNGAFAAPDIAPIALLGGHVVPIVVDALPVDVTFKLSGQGSNLTGATVSGVLGETTLDGQLQGNFEPVVGGDLRRFTGALSLSDLDFRFLSEAVLGSDQWFSARSASSLWPVAPFETPFLAGTDFRLELKADLLILDDQTRLESLNTDLRLTPSELQLDNISAGYGGGDVSGTLQIERTGAEAELSGRLKFEDLVAEELLWEVNGRSVATGSLDAELNFDSAGRSISTLVASLNGGGALSLHDGEVRGINPNAFDLVSRAADAGLELEDDKVRAFFMSHMAAGVMPYNNLEGVLSLAGGRLGLRNVTVESESADVVGSVVVDLNDWTLDGELSLKGIPETDRVAGADPQAGFVFEGPLAAPEREVDIAPLTAYLTLRAFEREVEKVEKLQAEILERDRLVRELKLIDEQKARAARQKVEAEAAAVEAVRAAEAARIEEDRLADERAEAERVEAEQRAAEEAAREAERLAQEAERLAREAELAAQKASADKAAAEKAAEDKLAAELLAAENAEAERKRAEEQREADALERANDNAPSEPVSQDAEPQSDVLESVGELLETLSEKDVQTSVGEGASDPLPPLEQPVVVDDLLAIPAESAANDNASSASATTQTSAPPRPVVRQDNTPKTKFITKKNGLVFEVPVEQ